MFYPYDCGIMTKLHKTANSNNIKASLSSVPIACLQLLFLTRITRLQLLFPAPHAFLPLRILEMRCLSLPLEQLIHADTYATGFYNISYTQIFSTYLRVAWYPIIVVAPIWTRRPIYSSQRKLYLPLGSHLKQSA
jgi:hypothetical protein